MADVASEVSESGYDVDAESSDDELDDEMPTYTTTVGRTIADRFHAPKKVHQIDLIQ